MKDNHYYLLSCNQTIVSILFLLMSLPLFAVDSSEQLATPKTATKSPTAVLPELPPLPSVPQQNQPLSAIDKITISRFEFDGNATFSSEELAKQVQDYLGREITAEQLQEAKNAITQYYIDKGYINSGAIIPNQYVQEGVVKITIVEGQLFKVDVSGTQRLYRSYVEKRLASKEGESLNINELQQRLQLLQQNPLFKRINAELGPGTKLGEGILKIEIEESRPYQFNFRFNNHRSPNIGAYRGEIEGLHRNLLGWGDTMFARYGITRGLDDYALGYSIPLNRNDMTLTMSAERNTAKVIDEPFNRLNVKSEASTYALALSYPLRFFSGEQVSDRTRTLDIGLKMEKRYSKTFLLDEPFPFSPGVEGDDNRKGESHISVVRFSQDWLDRSRTQVIAARSSFNFGIDAFDATIHEDGSPDSHFFSWLGQFQWVKRLPFFDSQILFRTDFQWANQDLLPLEKISIGGATTVRGYRENQLTRDNGLISSVEWRMPIMRIPMPGLSKESEDGLLYFAPFADYGRAWNTDSDTPDPKDIYSVGFGLRWAPIPKVQAEVYWGKALQDIPDSPDNDLQDKGIHFEISVLW